jgi:hypothetical protein
MSAEKLKGLIAPAIALICAGGALHLQWSQMQTIQKTHTETQPTKVYQLEEKQLEASLTLLNKLPTLGYDNLVADWTFLNFVQYFGDDNARNKTGYRLIPKYFEVVVQNDPLFLDMYPYLSSAVTLYGGNPIKTVSLLEKGIAAIPETMKDEAYFLWPTKGTDELLFLGKSQAARQSYLTGADWASQSQDPEIQAKAHSYRDTAMFLAKNPNSRRAQISAWMNILSSAIDEQTQQLAVQQIQKLGAVIEQKNGTWSVRVINPQD